VPARTRLGVLGWPVAHSRSPQMHNAALAEVGLGGWRYQLLPVAPELLAETVPALPRAGFRGVNVTIPHKQAALALATGASERASRIGAANTLIFDRRGGIHAENTDAPALLAALPFPPRGATALVLGAGGSARAVVWALLHAGAGEVLVWNRNPARAGELCAELGGTAVQMATPADLLVNCTSVGLHGERDPFEQLPISAADLAGYRCVVDLVYVGSVTTLLRVAAERGAQTVDGLELLVGQGALGFELFTGRTAPVAVMRDAIRRSGPVDASRVS